MAEKCKPSKDSPSNNSKDKSLILNRTDSKKQTPQPTKVSQTTAQKKNNTDTNIVNDKTDSEKRDKTKQESDPDLLQAGNTPVHLRSQVSGGGLGK